MTDIVCRGTNEMYSVCNGRKGSMKRYRWDPPQQRLHPVGIYKLRHVLEGIERILLPRNTLDPEPAHESGEEKEKNKEKEKEKENDEDKHERKQERDEEDLPSDIYLFGFHAENMMIMNVKSRSQVSITLSSYHLD